MLESLCCLLLSLCSLTAQPVNTEAPDPGSAATVQVQLEPPPQHPDESEEDYADWLDTESRRLDQLPEPANPVDAVKQFAHHANWILSVQCEPTVTWMLLGDTEPAKLAEVQDRVQRAQQLLSKAVAADDHDSEDLELLNHFASALNEVVAAKLGQANADQLNNAATDLTIWLDDERPGVAANASLWLGLLYAESDQPDRALAFLPLALVPVDNERAAFFARLQRCSLFAKGKSVSLALTLLLKMEERCSGWFDDASTAQYAMNACTYSRLRIASLPGKSLRPLTSEIMNQWVQRAREDLQSEAGEPAQVLRLYPAVPLLFTASAAELEQPPTPPSEKLTPDEPKAGVVDDS